MPFGFVQFEFGFLLGPGDGRFIVRSAPDSQPERILVLSTLGAPQRRFLAGRKGKDVSEAGPEPVPTSRATIIRPEPFEDDSAEVWLASLRADTEAADGELAAALAVLNRALHAYRAAHANPHARDVSERSALVVRIGYGGGDAVADGRFADAWEMPREGRRTRRSMESPEERFAALLGGRERALVAEELVLRARADLDAHRSREAALQVRVALEALLAELPRDDSVLGRARQELQGERGAVGDAANAALRGELGESEAAALDAATARMESVLRRRRLGA